MKKMRRIMAIILAVVMVAGLIPEGAIVRAAGDDSQVRVIVENNTLAAEDGAAWTGVLVDKTVTINESSTMMSVVVDALAGYKVEGAETNYITSINELSQGDDEFGMGGWMITLNDWFTSSGAADYTVANGSIKSGDTITVEYSCNWGGDIGSDWLSNDTSLKSLSFSTGELNEEFTAGTKEYTLTVPFGTETVKVNPTALNRNFQVRIYKGAADVSKPGYVKNSEIAIADKDALYIVIGDASWPSMNYGSEATTYTIHIKEDEKPVIKPEFIALEFTATAINGWVKGKTFSNDIKEYNIDIKAAGTSTLSLANTTKYDTELYIAKAAYKNSNGEDVSIDVKSGALTSLPLFDFGTTDLTITLAEIADPTNVSTFVFHVTRPLDVVNQLKASGIVLNPSDRALNTSVKYKDKTEGTFFQVDADGNVTTTTGVKKDFYDYQAYVLNDVEAFALTLTGNSNFVRIRVSDDNTNFTEVATGTESPAFSFGKESEKTIYIQTISDMEYRSNGFDNVETEGFTYTVKVVRLTADESNLKILTATTDSGTWYPPFDSKVNVNVISIKATDDLPVLTFTVPEGVIVTKGTGAKAVVLEPESDGSYKVELSTTAATIVLTKDGVSTSVAYSFKAAKRSALYDVPDKVVDYYAVDSQYVATGNYIKTPENTLAMTLTSLGNFGGYITYYYEDAIMNDPNNLYGIDFYAYGNAFADGGSAAESGQVWVSEDGKTWYALAGSEHYEDTTIRDYEITYSKAENGKTAWVDNQGNSNDGSANSGKWPNKGLFYMSPYDGQTSVTMKGILLPCIDGTIMGDSSTNSFCTPVKFGYVDYFGNGTIKDDVNPYVPGSKANGFDLSWAVDEFGYPVELPNGVHYIKVVTASNIWAGAYCEKSTESSGVRRTVKQETEVGKTDMPKSVIITDENGEETVIELVADTNVYDVKVKDVASVSINLDGAAADDNIYMNNKKIAADEKAEFAVGDCIRQVRVIVQNGDKEPVLFILNIESDIEELAENMFEETTEKLLDNPKPVVSSVNGEWMVLGLSRAGVLSDEYMDEYYKTVYKYVKDNGSSKLSPNKVTDNDRVILALASMGYDVTDIAKNNLLEPLADKDYVKKQGLNGPIWTLIALDSREYETLDAEGAVTRESLIEMIIDAQNEDGGFALSGNVSDVDMTAMAITALAPYYFINKDVEEVVDLALVFLSDAQLPNGAYDSATGAMARAVAAGNAESTAQVVIALSTLGIDASKDSRFIKNGNSVLRALSMFYLGDGQFSHTVGAEFNEMATEQAYLALVAYERYVDGLKAVYDMTDVKAKVNPVIDEPKADPSTEATPTAKPENKPSVPGSGAPKTGDEFPVGMVCVGMFASMAAILWTTRKKRYNNNF